MNNIIIFGNSGFIGTYIYDNLKKKYSVKGLNSKECDLLDKEAVHKCFNKLKKDTTIIIISSIVRTIDNSFNSYEKNVLMSHNISSEIQKINNVNHIIFLSTIDVYGIEQPNEIEESTLTNPADYYSMSKLTSEFMLKQVCANNHIPLTILRLPGVYGINETNSTLGKIFNSAKDGLVTIYGEGQDKRDFLFINDLYKIVDITIQKKYNGILNVVSGRSYSILEIINEIRKTFKNTKIVFSKEQANLRQKNLSFNNNKLRLIIKEYKFLSTIDGIHYLIKNYFKHERS